MSSQLEFTEIVPPVNLSPAQGRGEPVIWARKLAIFKSWPLNDASRLRVIELNRGLNILWAKPGAPDQRDPQRRSKISGHATGKTTFCRLLRFALGDANFGNDTFRQAFRDSFRNGWTMAEVFVSGQLWLVGRPMGEVGYHPFARQGATLESLYDQTEIPHGGFEDYLAAIDEKTLQEVATRKLASAKSELNWEQVLQWLSRDQEARFSDLLGWRHRASDSESQDLAQIDKENLVRVMLGFVTKEEQALIRDFNGAAEKHRSAIGERTNLARQVATDTRRLADLLNVPLDPAQHELSDSILDQRLDLIRNEVSDANSSIPTEEAIEATRAKLNALEGSTAIAREAKREIEMVVDSAKAQLELDEGKAVTEERLQAFREFKPFRGYCSHPLGAAWESQCPLADKRGSDSQLDDQFKQLKTKADVTRWQITNLGQELLRRQQVLNARVLEEAPIRGELRKLVEHRNSAIKATDLTRNRLRIAEELRKNLREARTIQDTNEATIKHLEVDKTDIDQKLDLSKAQHFQRIGEFERLYNFVVRELLGENVEATIKFSGKGIEPRVNYHGRLDSAALETVRLLSFDVAAMLASIVGQGHHPRFLLHDSPREADLSRDIYISLFYAVRRLENEAGGHANAPFQYIITTTEPAPDDINCKPWLLDPVLDASQAGTRLLGVDL